MGLLLAIVGAWFRAKDNMLVFNTIPIVCVKGPNRGEDEADVGVVDVGTVSSIIDSLLSRDNNSLAFARVVLVVLSTSLLYG